MCVDTSRAAAAIMAVSVTCLAGLRGGATVRTWTATLQELHVVWTFVVCRDKHFTILHNMRQTTLQLMSVIQGLKIQMNCIQVKPSLGVSTLTAKSCIPPLLGLATCMDTLSGELWDGFAEDRVSVVFRVAHISHTGFTEGFYIQKVLATAEWSTGEDLVTELLKKINYKKWLEKYILESMFRYVDDLFWSVSNFENV